MSNCHSQITLAERRRLFEVNSLKFLSAILRD